MKRNTKLTTLTSALSLTTLLVACGGGGSTSFITTGGDTAGIGGSGFISSGTITGFGSVFVNGVKFETTNTRIDIEGTEGSEEQLSIGMVVQVNGTINPDGITGTATSIVFDDQLQGPVSGYPTVTTNLTVANFTVLNTKVQIDRKTTYFDGDISFDNIRDGNMVELSGFFDNTGTLIASRIENKTGTDENVELKGTITGLIGSRFTLQGIPVDASRASLEDLSNGLTNNIQVEVKGTFTGGQINATKVESKSFEYGDSNELEIEGYVTEFTSLSNFKVNGIPVDASNNIQTEPNNLQIANNLQVEVEGRLVNGVLIAEEIKMRGGDVEVSARITSIDVANSRFEVTPVNGGNPIVIQTGMETQFENDINNSNSFPFSDLSNNDFVEVEGYLNNDGTLFASEVKVTEPDDIEIQAIIESFDLDQITLLGVVIITQPEPDFEGDNTITTLLELKDAVEIGRQVLVKVTIDPNSGIATELEIED